MKYYIVKERELLFDKGNIKFIRGIFLEIILSQ